MISKFVCSGAVMLEMMILGSNFLMNSGMNIKSAFVDFGSSCLKGYPFSVLHSTTTKCCIFNVVSVSFFVRTFCLISCHLDLIESHKVFLSALHFQLI